LIFIAVTKALVDGSEYQTACQKQVTAGTDSL